MIIGSDYYNNMDRGYYSENSEGSEPDIEKPIVRISELGQTVTEGRAGGGTLLDTMRAAIFRGAGKVELQLQQEGSEPFVGAESYGREMRQDIRDLSRVNQVRITSIHAPTWVGNLSGYAGRQQGFSDEYRAMQVEEIKKAIDFAADTTGGSAVVVHTGEFERPISESPWNKNGAFRQYEEEPQKAMYSLVDRRSGHVISVIRKDTPIMVPKWKTNEKGEFVDYEGNVVSFKDRVPEFDPKNPEKIIMEQKDWNYFIKEAEMRNRELERQKGRPLLPDERITPEEAFYISMLDAQEKTARGWAMNYAQGMEEQIKALEKLKEARKYYEELEKRTPKEQLWKIMREDPTISRITGGIAPSEYKLPTQLIDEQIKEIRERINAEKDMVTGQLQSAKEAEIAKQNVISLEKYAKNKTLHSYAELGIYAMQRTEEGMKQGKIDKPIFIAPENLFPEMGYGSHPEELIELVENARKKMVEYLTQPQIPDPSGALDPATGKPKMINNPYYRGMSREEAEKKAREHIKATLDTQHLGMWFKYFTPKPGETEEERFKRFEKWYLEEVKKMEEKGIIGHMHIVDGFGSGHTHLPAGEGRLPIRSAVEYLKKKGYTGTMSSEGYGEQGRQLTQAWAYFGSPIYHRAAVEPSAARSWTEVEHSYFSQMQTPYFVFGAYSPSNDWTLWSGVPLE
ncbi:MAG: hypothetical protein QXW00_00740 [Candidatus Woesearchaeota archaeon]